MKKPWRRNRPNRNPQSSRDRHKKLVTLHLVQDGLCAHCEEYVPHPDGSGFRPNGDTAPSLDHVVLRSNGGSNALTNLLLTHRGCNAARAHGPLCEAGMAMWRTNLVKLQAMGNAAT